MGRDEVFMISKNEIDTKAAEFEILPANVQRDYVFGWILFGLFTNSDLKDRIFLKGGNALRKGYFENTRFSPDLDFGTPGEVAQDELLFELKKVCSYIDTCAGIKFLNDEHKIREWYPASESVVNDLKVYDVRLYFQDFYGNAEHIKIRISIDFTRYDKVLLPLQSQELIHPYSDSSTLNCTIRCMKLEEIIATKLKCLLQRQHAPDLFDYVYSIRLLGGKLNRRELVTTFIRKTIFDRNPQVVKEILLKSPFGFFRDYWQKTIVCAKQTAIAAEEAISFFMKDLNDLFKDFPAGNYNAFQFFGPELRVPIMEAGRLNTCLRITYNGTQRLVEPYSLKYMQRKDGLEREYLYVYDRDGGHSGPGVKTLVAEKITKIENTQEIFEPQFPVELSKAGETPEDHYFFDLNRPVKSSSRQTIAHSPKYIYRCPHCGKEFKRDKMSSELNPHKNKNGRQCSGRYGYYVTTKW